MVIQSIIARSKFGTLVATEEFPFDVKFAPQQPTLPVLSEGTLDSGIHVVTKNFSTPVIFFVFN